LIDVLVKARIEIVQDVKATTLANSVGISVVSGGYGDPPLVKRTLSYIRRLRQQIRKRLCFSSSGT
jgi:hypothetical protein